MQAAFLQYFSPPFLPYQMDASVAPQQAHGPPSIICAEGTGKQ